MTFGSLFAGIGGFDLGLERAGMQCKWQVEIDKYASAVLAKHWPAVRRWGDVRTFPAGESADWAVDLICAGVPCQPVSIAGKRKGAEDERWMWGEALRVVADICPKFFVAENPAAILSHDGGRTFGGILRALSEVGYVCEWHSISASDIGAPHQRQRVWLVAYSDRVSRSEGQPRRTIGELLTASARPQRREDERQARSVAWSSSADARASEQWWSVEPSVGRVAHGIPNRVDRLRCLGNAVVPQIVEELGRAILFLEGTNER